MRKFTQTVGTLLALFALVTSCEKVIDDYDYSKAHEVTFTSAIGSRATDTQFEEGDKISVTAIETDGSFYAENVEYAFSSEQFISVSPISYASADQKLSFRAVYPAVEVPQDGALSFEVLANQNEGTNYTKSDLLSSFVDATSDASPKLVFDHLLSKVIINIKSSDVGVSGVSASAQTKVDYNIIDNTYSTSGSVSSITFASDGTKSYKAIIAPQEFLAGETFLKIASDVAPFTVSLGENTTLLPGKKYEYDVTIKQGVATIEVSDGGSGDIPYPDNEITGVTIEENVYGSLLVSTTVAEDFEGVYAIIPVMEDDIYMFGDVESYVKYFIEQDIQMAGTDYTVADGIYVYDGAISNFNVAPLWTFISGREYQLVAVGADSKGALTTAITISEPFIVPERELDLDVEFPDVEFGEVNLLEVSGATFTYDVVPTDKEMSYMVFNATKEYYDSFASDEDRFEGDMLFIADFVDDFGDDLQAGLTKLSYVGDRLGVQSSGLEFESDYVVYAYGIDIENLQPLTKIAVMEARTESYVLPTGNLNSITMSNIELANATATVDAGDYTGVYYFSLIDKSIITEFFGGDLDAFITEQLSMEHAFGTSFTAANGFNVFEGNIERHVGDNWSLNPQTEYTVFATAVDNLGNALGSPISADFTTADVPSDFSIGLEVSNIADESATVMATLSHEGITCIIDAIETSDYELMSEDDLAAYFEMIYGMYVDMHLQSWSGPKELSVKPGRDYTVVAFAYYHSLGKVSGVSTAEFSTTGTYVPDFEIPTDIVLSDVEFGTLEASVVTDNSIELSIKPNDKDMPYVLLGQLTNDFNLYGSDEEILQDNFEHFELQAIQSGYDYLELLSLIAMYGDYPNANDPNNSSSFFNLYPGMSFTFYVYGIDLETSQPTTEILKLEVTTTGEPMFAPEEHLAPMLPREIAPKITTTTSVERVDDPRVIRKIEMEKRAKAYVPCQEKEEVESDFVFGVVGLNEEFNSELTNTIRTGKVK